MFFYTCLIGNDQNVFKFYSRLKQIFKDNSKLFEAGNTVLLIPVEIYRLVLMAFHHDSKNNISMSLIIDYYR